MNTNLHNGCWWKGAGDPSMLLVEGQDYSWINRYPRHKAKGRGLWNRAVGLMQVVSPPIPFSMYCFEDGHKRFPRFMCNQVLSFL